MKWRRAFECTNTYFLSARPSFCRGKKFPNTSCPNQLLLQELLKSNAQTRSDTKEGQKEEIVTEVWGFNIQDDVRHFGVRNSGGAGSCGGDLHQNFKDSARRHLQKSVSPPLQRFMSGSISFLVLSLKRPLVIHRGMTNSQVWQVGQTIWIQDPTGTVDKPVCPPLQRFLARFIQIDSVHFPPALMTWTSFHVAIFNLRWFRPVGGFSVIWRMHKIAGGLFGEFIHFAELSKLCISAFNSDFCLKYHNHGLLKTANMTHITEVSLDIQHKWKMRLFGNSVKSTVQLKYAPKWSESGSTAWETSFLKNLSPPGQPLTVPHQRKMEPQKIQSFSTCTGKRLWANCAAAKIRQDLSKSFLLFSALTLMLFSHVWQRQVKWFSWWMWTKSRANQHINEYILSIPDICHSRHGHVRVNFFWPV